MLLWRKRHAQNAALWRIRSVRSTADTGGISANDAERFLFREERVDHVEKIRIRRKILRQRYVQVRFVRLRDAYSRAGGHVHVPAVRRYYAAPVIRGERNDKGWRGGRKPLKTETPKPWSASIGNQTT